MTGILGDLSRLHFWTSKFKTEHRLIGSSILRLGLGSLVTFTYASAWPVRMYVWGPRGIYPAANYSGPSLFGVQFAPVFDLLYVTGLIVSLLFALGWHTRIMVVPFVVFTWSLIDRNPLALNGSETLLFVSLPYFLFLNSSAYFSLDARRHRRSKTPEDVASPRPWRATFHNLAVLCLLIQLCILYGTNAFNKMRGPPWQEGIAMWTIWQLEEFGPAILKDFLLNNSIIIGLATYFTVLFEASYPFLIWFRRGRVVAFANAVLLHLGTMVFMGLVNMGAKMIVFQAVILSDDQYRWLKGFLKSFRFPQREMADASSNDTAVGIRAGT